MSEADPLGKFAYLWESGEWTVAHSFNVRGRVVIAFETCGPSLKEMQTIRNTVDRYRDQPVADVMRALRGCLTLDLGDEDMAIANRLQNDLLSAGLSARVEDASYEHYLPVQKDLGAVLIIEDSELARAVCEEMIRRGVPVTYADPA